MKTDGEEMPAEWAGNGWDGDDDWEFSSAADDSPEELYALYDAAVDRARTRSPRELAGGGLDRQVALAEKLGGRSACAGSSATSSRSTAGTPARPT